MNPRTVRERFRYRFDNVMSKRGFALIPLWMGFVFGLGVIIALFLSIVDQQPSTLKGTLSQMWARGLGVFFIQTGDGNIGIEVLTLLYGLIVLFVSPVMAGIVIVMAMKRLTALVSGRSVVLEKGHTVILGWSEQVYAVIAGLVKANKSRGKTTIAVLATENQLVMEDLIKQRVGDTGSTRIVCRTGNPIDTNDIKVVNLDEARSIIALNAEGPGADNLVIRTLLAVTNSADRSKSPYQVVASVSDSRNHPAAQIAGGPETAVVNADDITAKLVVLTARQSGLSSVYTELLNYDGDEVYIVKEPALAGKTFGEALLAYDTSAVMGLQAADGTVRLKPPMATMIAQTDKIIAISADDSSVRVGGAAPAIVEQAIAPVTQRPATSAKTLLLGWNRRGRMILQTLDSSVGPESTVRVVAGSEHEPAIGGLIGGTTWTNITVTYAAGDTTSRETLEGLEVGTHDHVIVLSPDTMDFQEADSETLVTLLHLRDMHEKHGEPGRHYSIVSEMLDDRNRRLGQLTKADDFIVSSELIALLITQLSENRNVGGVFADLFDPQGAEIYLKPAEDYVALGQQLDFYTVIEAARRREEVAIGFRAAEQSGKAPGFGVVLNPNKKSKVTFKAGDRVIVLADN